MRVRAGPRSSDEMAELGLQLMPKSADEGALLVRAFDERDMLANIAQAEMRVRESPESAEFHAVLGGTYVEVGRFADAIPHLQTALRLKDRSAPTYNSLGVALMAEGRVADALAEFRRAAALAPRDERIPFNHRQRAQPPLAARRGPGGLRSIARDQSGLSRCACESGRAAVLDRKGQRGAASTIERAVELRPDSAAIHSNYGSALASSGRFSEALRHVRKALELDPSYAPARDTLNRLLQMGVK